jgi:hypothetical protein
MAKGIVAHNIRKGLLYELTIAHLYLSTRFKINRLSQLCLELLVVNDMINVRANASQIIIVLMCVSLSALIDQAVGFLPTSPMARTTARGRTMAGPRVGRSLHASLLEGVETSGDGDYSNPSVVPLELEDELTDSFMR